ncbi:DUF6089 family protein [Haliscomenobacter sp.]|uniref:DUF6089 family protein n=1 Tax=Haliscomenobacter sp. TaxID=2717303 RepID=UPI0035945526
MKKLLLALAMILPFYGISQDLDFGITGGIGLYSGDLSPKEFAIYPNDYGLAGGIFLRQRYSRFIGVRAGLTLTKIMGDERNNGVNVERGLNFQSNITEFSLIGEIHLFHIGYARNKTVISPYVAFGLGLFAFNPKIDFNGQILELRALTTEGQGLDGYPNRYNLTQFNIPFGAGVNILINDRLTIGAELIFRSTLTDHLDDVSDARVKYGDILTNRSELSARISNPLLDPASAENLEVTYSRGGKHNDWYSIPALTLSWRIKSSGKSKSKYSKFMECPRF